VVITLSDKIKFYDGVFGVGNLDKKEKNYYVWCPICRPSAKEKRKLVIRVEDDACHCWTCGFKARTLVSLLYKFSTREKLALYKEKINTSANILTLSDLEPKNKPLKLPESTQLLNLAPNWHPDTKAAFRYLSSRGITPELCWRYQICISNDYHYRRRILIPSFDVNGKLNFYVGRSIDNKTKPKYINPDVDRLSVIFDDINIDWSKQLIICEGVFDMIKCGENSVPLLGSELNESSLLFNKIVANHSPVILALDADARKKTLRIYNKLLEYDVNVKILDVKTDPGDMSRDGFKELLSSAYTLSWQDMMIERLNKVVEINMSC